MNRLLLLLALGTLCFSCGNSRQDDRLQQMADSLEAVSNTAVVETVEGTDSGYRNEVSLGDTGSWNGSVRIPIHGTEQTASGRIFTAETNYKGEEIGIRVMLPEKSEDSKGGFGKGLVISSMGAKSDHFLEALAGLYRTKYQGKKFRKELKLAYVDLNEMAVMLGNKNKKSDLIETKLFYEEPGNENAYFELYLNINEKEGWLEFAEKDESYRENIIKAFSAK